MTDKRWICPKKISNMKGDTINTNYERWEPKKIQGNLVSFRCKDCAYKYSDEFDTKNKLKLFQQNIKFIVNGNKIVTNDFILTSYHNIFQMSKAKKCHFYEYYRDDENIKLGLDIDLEIENNKSYDQEKFDDIVNKAISFVNSLLEKYQVPQPKIIILNASTNKKYSAHILYTNIFFSSVKHIKFFICSDKEFLKYYIDQSIYSTGCFRIIWNSKIDKNNPLKFHKGINYKKTSDWQLFKDSLLKSIPKNPFIVPYEILEIPEIPKEINNKKYKTRVNNSDIKCIVSIADLQKYLNILSNNRCTQYDDWLLIGLIIHNTNNSLNGFNLWDMWSRKAYNYQGVDYNRYKWSTFKNNKKVGIATLKFMAKQDNPVMYDKIERGIEDINFQTIDINKNYLLELKESIKMSDGDIAKKIRHWVNNDKTIAILSPYDTGKTTMIKKIITEYDNFKKILFITYRKTLTNDILDKLKELGFYSYMDYKNIDKDRLICQIESLYKIPPEDNGNIREYDLIILDECESLLNHFSSPTIKIQEHSFSLMQAFLHNCGKIMALDGDFHNRSYTFLKEISSEFQIIRNTIKKDNSKYIFTDDKNKFDNMIDKDLANKKNVVIISMSSEVVKKYERKYSGKYNMITHISENSKQNSKVFENITDTWKDKQLVAYSPTLESGVDFSLDHFDKKYIILSKNSTSPRGLLQMIARVRKIRNNNIWIYLNGIPFKESGNVYTYDEVKKYVLDTYSERIKIIKPTFDIQQKKYVSKYEENLYTKIMIYNKKEEFNKNVNLFIPVLLQMLKRKGATYSKDLMEKKIVIKTDNITKEDIVNIPMISYETYLTFDAMKKENELGRDGIIALNKFYYKKMFYYDKFLEEKEEYDNRNMFVDNNFDDDFGGDIDIQDTDEEDDDDDNIEKTLLEQDKKDKIYDPINDDFMTKYYRKEYILYNLRLMFEKITQDDIVRDEINKKYVISFKKTEKMNQINGIKDLLSMLGYSTFFEKENGKYKCLNDDFKKIKIRREEFNKKIDNCLDKSEFFTDIDKTVKLYGLSKDRFEKMNVDKNSNRKTELFLRSINSIIKNYSLKIERYKVGYGNYIKISYYIEILNDFIDYI